MQLFHLIFFDSFLSVFLLTTVLLHSEIYWFAALEFHSYSMWLPTIAAIAGSTLGMLINYAAGYIMSMRRQEWAHYNARIYERIAYYARRYGVLILLFQWMPFISIFALVAGLFRVPPALILIMIIAGRTLYYGYYLLVP